MDVYSQGRALRLLRQRNVTFRAMVMQGIIPRYPSLNPNSSREVVSSEDIDAAIRARGAVPALPSPDCVPARRPRRVA